MLLAMSDPVTRLNEALEGRYAIERELGEGGMATVYLAKDLKHNRNVALKVLKPELAAVVGAERFLAEIEVTANLQHPNILPLFDSGEAESFLFYVMPFVEGETLRDRIDREHQLPVEDAVSIATNVAEALDYAHRQGVIHRDIKPANILLQDGKPVISDFGIALAVGVAGGGRLTETGRSVGTPHYMSPEQATGDLSVGAATDIYALGCVLYEMLIAEPPYTGGTPQVILGKIIAGELASATKHRSSVPANVDAAIRRALEKVPADRFTSAQEFVRALGDEHFRYGELAAAGVGAASGPWNRLSIGLATALAVTTLTLGWSFLRPEPPGPLARFSLSYVGGPTLQISMEFTADGSALVYTGPGESGVSQSQLWIRRWPDLDAAPIRGTEGAVSFALSPDGREVAFAGFPGPLRVVSLNGGTPRTLVEQVSTVSDWAPDGTVYFTSTVVLSRVGATGGGADAVETVTELQEEETRHGSLRVLPGGRMAVFQVWYLPGGADAEIWAVDLDTQERRFLASGRSPRYASTGHLLFVTPDGVLVATPFDPGTAELTDDAVAVAEGLRPNLVFGIANYDVSRSGSLVYAEGASSSGVPMVWVSRNGSEEVLDQAFTGLFEAPSFSPDGGRVAVQRQVGGANEDIWIYDFGQETFSRLTFEGRKFAAVLEPGRQ